MSDNILDIASMLMKELIGQDPQAVHQYKGRRTLRLQNRADEWSARNHIDPNTGFKEAGPNHLHLPEPGSGSYLHEIWKGLQPQSDQDDSFTIPLFKKLREMQ